MKKIYIIQFTKVNLWGACPMVSLRCLAAPPFLFIVWLAFTEFLSADFLGSAIQTVGIAVILPAPLESLVDPPIKLFR